MGADWHNRRGMAMRIAVATEAILAEGGDLFATRPNIVKTDLQRSV